MHLNLHSKKSKIKKIIDLTPKVNMLRAKHLWASEAKPR
jgi:hypothetical protein